MPEKPVTHEHLAMSMNALNGRFERHELHFQDVSNRLFEKVDRAIELAHSNSLHIAAIQGEMSAILGGRNEHLGRLAKNEEDVAELKLVNSRREGERGVVYAMVRSPLITALISAIVAIGAVIWAGAKNIMNHAPAVIFGLACTVLLTASAFAKGF